jgi:hypothetical protein
MAAAADTQELVDPVAIYSIVVGNGGFTDPEAYSYFSQLSEQTGGKAFVAASASEVVDAILEAIGELTGGGDPPPPPTNRAPDTSMAAASISQLWPADHRMVDIQILNVKDPDGDAVTITISGITQDEPVKGQGSGNTSPDGAGVGTAAAQVRAERSGKERGRVYKINFTASDGKGGQSMGSVMVCVPHDRGGNTTCSDGGQLYDSTAP